jgi:hypothetical protein
MPKMNHHGLWNGAAGISTIPTGPGITPIVYTAEWLVATYTFTDGRDLDTRTKITSPPIMTDYIGWARNGTSGGVLTWGGDNTGLGLEAIAIDVALFKNTYGATKNTLIVDFRCFWYATVGTAQVSLSLVLYKGGNLVKSGYGWTNPTAAQSKNVVSTSKAITLKTQDANTSGTGLARLTYNVFNGVGYLDTNIA